MTQPAAIHTITLRCTQRLPASGRQRRSLATDPSGLCGHQLAKQRDREKDSDFAKILMGKAVGFQTAQGSLPAIGRDISSGIEAGLKRALEAKQSSSAS
jgi:hypothetical protein